MKNGANRRVRGARGSAWSELSNINFGDYQVKQTRFAKRVKKEGIQLVHDAPSLAPLKAIPEA
jgi:hypothetical protein